MSNIFNAQRDVNNHAKRNNHDLSHKVNATFKLGGLYPVMCMPVVPGDSFDIQAAYNMKLMPIVFPVQSKIRAHMHFFYVRNKNLWTNWENWISNLTSNSEHPHPYITPTASKVKNGSIFDFLGVPTSLIQFGERDVLNKYQGQFLSPSNTAMSVYPHSGWSNSIMNGDNGQFLFFEPQTIGLKSNSVLNTTIQLRNLITTYLAYGDVTLRFYAYVTSQDNYTLVNDSGFSVQANNDGTFTLTSSIINATQSYASVSRKYMFALQFGYKDEFIQIPRNANLGLVERGIGLRSFTEYSESGLNTYGTDLPLNALPFRAYESIYNAFYRNWTIDPLKISGQVAYNRYNTELGDGADGTDYEIKFRNYELDYLTSALPSPQQGVAPLVGMTALGDITIEDENGLTTAHAEIDNDGTISKVVLTSPAASNEHARTAMNIAASGMSINDFRNTNALQKLLETNIRKGYKYIDFIAGHFGKEPHYNELDMPEFIGGFSRDVNISTVVSQADTLATNGAALGQYGGYGSVAGGTRHNIRHYCDDYGYIVGILSIVPTPCYSQLLSKHLIAPDNFLNYYFPEFANVGLQPITYREVAPLQTSVMKQQSQDVDYDDTFGYQRPNYDLVSMVDSVHGEFRGTMSQFVLNRIFDARPELGKSFIQIDPKDMNQIFVDTDVEDDTILGEIAFNVFAKRPIPRVVIPSLGR